jgi:hypothetical protein
LARCWCCYWVSVYATCTAAEVYLLDAVTRWGLDESPSRLAGPVKLSSARRRTPFTMGHTAYGTTLGGAECRMEWATGTADSSSGCKKNRMWFPQRSRCAGARLGTCRPLHEFDFKNAQKCYSIRTQLN